MKPLLLVSLFSVLSQPVFAATITCDINKVFAIGGNFAVSCHNDPDYLFQFRQGSTPSEREMGFRNAQMCHQQLMVALSDRDIKVELGYAYDTSLNVKFLTACTASRN